MIGELKVKWCKKIAHIYETTNDPFIDKLVKWHDFENMKST